MYTLLLSYNDNESNGKRVRRESVHMYYTIHRINMVTDMFMCAVRACVVEKAWPDVSLRYYICTIYIHNTDKSDTKIFTYFYTNLCISRSYMKSNNIQINTTTRNGPRCVLSRASTTQLYQLVMCLCARFILFITQIICMYSSSCYYTNVFYI